MSMKRGDGASDWTLERTLKGALSVLWPYITPSTNVFMHILPAEGTEVFTNLLFQCTQQAFGI